MLQKRKRDVKTIKLGGLRDSPISREHRVSWPFVCVIIHERTGPWKSSLGPGRVEVLLDLRPF